MKRKQPPPSKSVVEGASESTDESEDDKTIKPRKKTKTTRSKSIQTYEYKTGTLIVKGESSNNKEYETSLDDFKNTLEQSVQIAIETEYKPTQFYIPQLGDDIVFIRDGYRSFCDSVKNNTALSSFIKYFKTKQTPDGFERDVSNFPPSIRCIVSRIDYKNISVKDLETLITRTSSGQTKPYRFNFFTVSLTVKEIMSGEIIDSTLSYSVNVNDVFNFDLFYYNDSKPFIITYEHYLKSVEYFTHLRVDMSISMDFIDTTPPSTSTYTGRITMIESKTDEPKSLFENLSIVWDTTDTEFISVWEIKDVEEEAKLVLPKIGSTLQSNVLRLLEEFSATSDYLGLPLIQKSPYPILFATVVGRLQSSFYRTVDSLVSDLAHITKCVKQEMPKKQQTIKAMMKYMEMIEKSLQTKKITQPTPGMSSEIIVSTIIAPPPPAVLTPPPSTIVPPIMTFTTVNSEDEATESSDSDSDTKLRRQIQPSIISAPEEPIHSQQEQQPETTTTTSDFVIEEPTTKAISTTDRVEESNKALIENSNIVLLPPPPPSSSIFMDIPKIAKKPKPETKPLSPPPPTAESSTTQVLDQVNININEVVQPPVVPNPSSPKTSVPPSLTPSLPDIPLLPSIKKKGEDKSREDKKKEEKKEKKKERKEKKEKKEKKKDDKKKIEEKKNLTVTIKIPPISQQPVVQPETDLSSVKIPKRKKETVTVPIQNEGGVNNSFQNSTTKAVEPPSIIKDSMMDTSVDQQQQQDHIETLFIPPQPINPNQEEIHPTTTTTTTTTTTVDTTTTDTTTTGVMTEIIQPPSSSSSPSILRVVNNEYDIHSSTNIEIGGFEGGGFDSEIIPVYIPQKPTAPSIKLGLLTNRKRTSPSPIMNIFETADEYKNCNHEITLNIQVLENNRIKVILENNPNFNPIESEKKKNWTRRLNNNFKNVGTTSSLELIAREYGTVSKKSNKGFNLNLPIFSTSRTIDVSRETIPTTPSNSQIPKQLFMRKHENIHFCEKKRLMIVDHLKFPIAHYQIHMTKDSDMMEDENKGLVTFNIKCDATDSERTKFHSLSNHVIDARRYCSNQIALSQNPEPKKFFELNEKLGFLNCFEWFIEGFYFKERRTGGFYTVEFVCMENNTEISIDCQ